MEESTATPSPPPNIPERPLTERRAECAFQAAHHVSGHIENFVGPTLAKTRLATKRIAYIHALFIRAKNWMKSVSKLNQPSDFQPLAAATRALFELNIDMAILHHDANGEWAEKIEAWENSARYKHGECIARYYERKKQPLPEQYADTGAFLNRERDKIEAARLKFWPVKDKPGKGKHPDQWSHQNLLAAAIYADEKHGTELEEFYETKYRFLCMNVHGSTLAGIKGFGQDGLNRVCSQSLLACSEFGMEISKLALQSLDNWWRLEEVRKLHRDVDLQRLQLYIRVRGDE